MALLTLSWPATAAPLFNFNVDECFHLKWHFELIFREGITQIFFMIFPRKMNRLWLRQRNDVCAKQPILCDCVLLFTKHCLPFWNALKWHVAARTLITREHFTHSFCYWIWIGQARIANGKSHLRRSANTFSNNCSCLIIMSTWGMRIMHADCRRKMVDKDRIHFIFWIIQNCIPVPAWPQQTNHPF